MSSKFVHARQHVQGDEGTGGLWVHKGSTTSRPLHEGSATSRPLHEGSATSRLVQDIAEP